MPFCILIAQTLSCTLDWESGKVSTEETWEAGIAQMARGQVGRLKKGRAGHAQPHTAQHMLFVQEGKRVLLFAPAHWLLLSLLASAEERRSRLHENETVNVVLEGDDCERREIQPAFEHRRGNKTQSESQLFQQNGQPILLRFFISSSCLTICLK